MNVMPSRPDPPVTRDLAVPRSVLAIGAHPDDIEFGCGATLAKWAAAGSEVHLLVLTDGAKGSWDPAADLVALVARRRREQRAAADVLGATGVHHLDFIDGELESGRAERAAVCEIIRRVRPMVVLGHDPWKRYRLHPDHLHAGRLTVDGIVAARDPHFHPGHGDPHRPADLLLFEAEITDHVENAEGFLETKTRALLCHESQWQSTMGIESRSTEVETQRSAFAARVRDDAGLAGGLAGLALGEAFKLVPV